MNEILPSEIDGEVKPKLLETLSRFIRSLRSSFSIHYMKKGSHSVKSFHYTGEAADGHLVKFTANRKPSIQDENVLIENLINIVNKSDKTLFEQAIIARLSGFNGVGMYPDWVPASGLHCDLRPDSLQWIGLNREKLSKLLIQNKEEQIYIYLR